MNFHPPRRIKMKRTRLKEEIQKGTTKSWRVPAATRGAIKFVTFNVRHTNECYLSITS